MSYFLEQLKKRLEIKTLPFIEYIANVGIMLRNKFPSLILSKERQKKSDVLSQKRQSSDGTFLEQELPSKIRKICTSQDVSLVKSSYSNCDLSTSSLKITSVITSFVDKESNVLSYAFTNSKNNMINRPKSVHTTRWDFSPADKSNSEILQSTIYYLSGMFVTREAEQKKRNIDEETKVNTNHECSKTMDLQEFCQIAETELICSICTELLIEATALNCSHTFCKYCIMKWRKESNFCPICRTLIRVQARAIALDNFIQKILEILNPKLIEYRMKVFEERNAAISGLAQKFEPDIMGDLESDQNENVSDTEIETDESEEYL